ncbi:MAG: hypothetical protein WCJ94_01850 [bacterium]
MQTDNNCPLCKRETQLVPHHVIPKTLHSENWFKKHLTPEQMNITFLVCVDCHSAIHKFHSSKELANDFNTLEKIMADEKIMNFAKFAAKQKGGIGQRSMKKRGSEL